MVKKVIILGAAGRDFHTFNTIFKDNTEYEVVAFTANQIPFIANKTYPKELAGKHYKSGIRIYDETELPELIKKKRADVCVLAYSDLPYVEVMHKSSIVNSNGADFWLIAPEKAMLVSKKPVVAVCAVRTGSGKSQTSRYIAKIIKESGKRPVVIRHPMPYGDLKAQAVQRFTTLKDLDRYKCTIEEREDYEPHIRAGTILYAGVDYKAILEKAEKEADIIIWDGGNNDAPFIKPDLMITVADPLRVGNELTYYPGETVARMADILLINKVNSATSMEVENLVSNLSKLNSRAEIIKVDSIISVKDPSQIEGKRALVIEDGPTITHGGMKFGAGTVAAKNYGAKEIINAKEYAVGSIADTYRKYPNLSNELPAMGYNKEQINSLRETINKADCDIVISATPTDLSTIIKINKPLINVSYELREKGSALKDAIANFIKKNKQ